MSKLLTLFMFMVFSSLHLQAAETTVPKMRPVTTKEILDDSNGNELKIALTKYINLNDELEVRIEAAGIPRFASKVNPVLGFGRDIDDDGKIDTWFFVTKTGIDTTRIQGKDELGRDILGNLIIKKYQSTLMMYVTSAVTSITSYLFISVNESQNVMEDYYRDWMDLEEARIQYEEEFDNMATANTYNQMQYHNELISMGYKELANRMETFGKQTFYGYAFADLGLWITGGVVFNWGAKILARVGLIASETAFITAVKDTFFGFLEKQKALVENKIIFLREKLQTTKTKLGMKTAKTEVTAALTVATWKKALSITIKAQKSKSKILKFVTKSMKFPKAVYQGAKSEWQYIAMNTVVQIGSEAGARYDEIYDPNPVKMAKNLLSNPDVIQNLTFMATDTVLMTGISKNLKTTKARFMASGAVALTNSSFTNLVVKDGTNISRVALDTGWEVLIGNAQVQFDLKSLEYFEKMALKKNNPKIKLVGYVVALVDMGVGYVAYSKASSAVEKIKPAEPKVMLVPILATQP
ncbi:MAG: hypothetical protein H7177_11070 [Rhizobacter sp.]|nr:hypothetical protein [Bacteriovorax sp.]